MSDFDFDPFSDEITEIDATDVTSKNVGEIGNWVSQPGKYHVICNGVTFQNLKQSGDVIRIPKVELVLSVLDGEHPSEKKKKYTHEVLLMRPENWGDFGRDKSGGPLEPLSDTDKRGILNLYYAFGVVGTEVFGKKGRVSQKLFENMLNAMAVVEISERKGKDGNMYKQIKGSHVWRVTDPKVVNVPKDHEVLHMAGVTVDVVAGPDSDADGLDLALVDI
mgnify:CR=1 FL=1